MMTVKLLLEKAIGANNVFLTIAKAMTRVGLKFETFFTLSLQVSEGKAKAPGEAPRNAYLLPELCYPTGLTDAMRKDFKHMKELSQYTRLDPEKRRQSTERLLNTIHGNERCCALLERWGIHLDRQLVSFQSRELEAEKVSGGLVHTWFLIGTH